MGLSLRYLNDNHGVMATVSGALTGAELVEAAREVNAFAVYTTPICYVFFDSERLSSISFSIGDLATAALCAREAAELCQTERIVAIFANDENTYRLALIYMVFIEQTGWEAWTFRDRNEAVAWLRSRAALKHGITVEAI